MSVANRRWNKVEKIVFCLILISMLLPISHATNNDANEKITKKLNQEDFVEVIIILKDPDDLSKVDLSNRRLKVKNLQESILHGLSQDEIKQVKRFPLTNGFSGIISKKGYDKIKNNPSIKSIRLVEKEYVLLTESVPIIEANLVQNLSFTGEGQTVCVIDTGVDYGHPNLGSCTLSQFLSNSCSKIIGGYDFWNDDSDPMDDFGHGTHVAGIVASDSTIYRGVAPDSRLIALKVCGKNFSEGCSTPNMISAIDWCISNASKFNITVITISIGGGAFSSYCDDDDDRKQSIDLAIKNNIFVTIASGNNGFIGDISAPACVENATSIGATDKNDNVATYSNRNQNLDLLAPGGEWGSSTSPYSEIVSTFSPNVSNDPNLCFIRNTQGICFDTSYNVTPYFIRSIGTSMAAPHVAGIAALLQDAYDGNLTPSQILWILNESGEDVWDSEVETGLFSEGKYFPRVNALKALEYASYLDIQHTDWPTQRHDNRRTAFTILKGDMNASNIDNYNLYLTNGTSQEYVIRTSIADIDGNGYMEAVTVAHEKISDNETDGKVYAFERNRRFNEICPSFFPFCWENERKWHVSVNSGGAL
ncbi:S8 family serine peptidase [Candidatus Woesearchaeota archaeon]|nr:S8 family serine peptidase [Candidatus Woesearchaeota archaeon]